jgi:hypothetical protein
LDSFDASKTYYYLPLSGFSIQGTSNLSVDEWANLDKTGMQDLPKTIYGVRKGDIEAVKLQSNWINLETHIAGIVAKLKAEDIHHVLLKYVDCPSAMRYNDDIAKDVAPTSLYVKLGIELNVHCKDHRHDKYALAILLRKFNSPISVDAVVDSIHAKVTELKNTYPLLQYIGSANSKDITDYINLVDNSKGI